MRNRGRELDMAKPFSSDLGLDNLDTAFLADYAAVLHALVLAAVAFEILYRTENLGAEEPISFRLECSIIYCLRLLHLTMGPIHDLLGRSKAYLDILKLNRRFWLLKKIK